MIITSPVYVQPDPCGLQVVWCAGETALTVEDKIRIAAEQAGVDPNLAVTIGVCESGLRNVNNPTSSAAGIMQLTRATADETGKRMGNGWGYKDVYNVERNIEMAMWLMSKGEYWRWQCWKGY